MPGASIATRSPRGEHSSVRMSKIPNSRYRLLDHDEQRQEAETVERIIRDLNIQRRSNNTKKHNSSNMRRSMDSRPSSADPSRSRRGSITNSSAETVRWPEASTSPTVKSSRDCPSSRCDLSPQTRSPPPSKEKFDTPSDSFQQQILVELRRLKEAQRQDLAAIEQLKREKHDAEERARKLAKQLECGSIRPSSFLKKNARDLVIDDRNDEVDSLHDSRNGNNLSHQNLLAQGEAGDESLPQWATFPDDVVDLEDNDDLPPDYEELEIGAPLSPLESPQWTTNNDSPPPRIFNQRGRTSSTMLMRSQSPQLSCTQTGPSSRSGGPRASRSPPRGRSATPRQRQPRSRSNSVDLAASRRSCAFFEEKERHRLEEEQTEREAAGRIARAAKAKPPNRLLEHQEAARQRKQEQLRELQREMNAELAKEKRAKAREVPLSTYLPPSVASEGANVAVDSEAQRLERMRKRSQDLLQSAALPPRMATATTTTGDKSEPPQMTIKMKKKLQEEAEREAERRRRRPKPVPDFDRLHRNWEKVLAHKRAKLSGLGEDGEDDGIDVMSSGGGGAKGNQAKTATECKEFFKSRADKLEELRTKKEARKQKLLAEEQMRLQKEKEAQEKLLRRIRKESASVSTGWSSSKGLVTKAEQLRVQKLLADAAQAEKQRRREQQETEAREKKLRDASRRVAAQVRQSEARRRDEYSGTFVELPADQVNEKAKESREQFREAMKRNREKILAAVALKPSLMERFTTDVKREEHKRAALEAVVSNVFKGDKSAMRGVLTDEEQALADDLVAGAEEDKGEDE